jgi:hypothetical protein
MIRCGVAAALFPVVDFILHRTTGRSLLSYWGGYTFLSQIITTVALFAFGAFFAYEGSGR